MKRKIRLLAYADIGGSGGYERYCKGIFGSGATPEDMEVTLVTSRDFYARLAPLDPNIRLITSDAPASASRFRRYYWHTVSYPRLARTIRPDLEFYPSGQIRLFLRSAQTIATCHNLLLFDPQELARIPSADERAFFSTYARRQRSSFSKANALIFLSDHSRQVVTGQLPGCRASTVIPHGLDDDFAGLGPRAYALGSQVTLLYVSSIMLYKYQAEVVHAVAQARRNTGVNLHLRLVGGSAPSGLEAVEKAIAQEDAFDFVHLVGPVGQRQLLDEHRSADICVFASACETFGISLLEAMAAGLPIVCSNRSGLPDLLGDAGVYFDPKDKDAIASGIETLLASEELRAELGRRAQDYARAYSWRRSAESTFEFIRRLASARTWA